MGRETGRALGWARKRKEESWSRVERLGRLGCVAGMGWIPFFFSFLLFSFFFLSKLHPNLIEFKLKFEFKPHLLTQ